MQNIKTGDTYYEMARNDGKFDLTPMKEIVAFINANTSKNAKILDIGCGTANILNCIRGNYTGLDVSEYAVQEADGRWPDATFIVSNLKQLPFTDGMFDMVLSFSSLEHFSDPKQVLSEVCRVLKAGGYFIVNAPNHELPLRMGKGYTIAPPCLRHESFVWRFGFFIKRLHTLGLRSLGFDIFEMTPNNIFDMKGIYKRGDDDLRYLVCSSTIVRYLGKHGMRLRYFYSRPVGLIKQIARAVPGLRYVGTPLAAVFEKEL